MALGPGLNVITGESGSGKSVRSSLACIIPLTQLDLYGDMYEQRMHQDRWSGTLCMSMHAFVCRAGQWEHRC